MSMSGSIKNQVYKDVSGLHFPDAVVGSQMYYAINIAEYKNAENETITKVRWILPECISGTDNYLINTQDEAYIKLITNKVGHFKIKIEITSNESFKESKRFIQIMLRVV